jgi:hypothetical protein
MLDLINKALPVTRCLRRARECVGGRITAGERERERDAVLGYRSRGGAIGKMSRSVGTRSRSPSKLRRFAKQLSLALIESRISRLTVLSTSTHATLSLTHVQLNYDVDSSPASAGGARYDIFYDSAPRPRLSRIMH